MNSKQRVQLALERKPADRIPIYMWFHIATKIELAKLLDIPIFNVESAMGNDIQQAWINNNYIMEDALLRNSSDEITDYWGIKWKVCDEFAQIIENPLQRVPIEDLAYYRFPVEHLNDFLARMQPIYKNRHDFFIGCDVSPCMFAMYSRLRGMESALIDMVMNPDQTKVMLRMCGDFAKALAEQACEQYSLDWLWTGDDVASQNNLLFNPSAWREMLKPHMKSIFDVGKSRGLWIAYHCCGAMSSIIPDLIEIGMDVLNPIQSNCPGMDPLRLKREFGSRIAFMGGLDTVDLLPNGDPNKIRQSASDLIEGMTFDGGGFIMAGTHAIPPETPIENIFALYDAVGISQEEIFDKAATIRGLINV